MGRIKATLVKRIVKRALVENPGRFKNDFSSNKKTVEELMEIPSKKLKNVIVGYITRLSAQKK